MHPEPTNSQDTLPDCGQGRSQNLRSVLAIGWLAAFFVFFYSFTLPNSNPRTSRLDLWQQLPDLYLFTVMPHQSGVQAHDDAMSSWANLPQRFDLLLVAAVIMAGAWALGHLLLRLIRVLSANAGLERTVFAFGLGLSALSLITLFLGLAGLLLRPLLCGVLAVSVLTELAIRYFQRDENANEPDNYRMATAGRTASLMRGQIPFATLLRGLAFVTVGLFLLAMLLGSMLPSIDFDVKEYHLQGPKEFYQARRVTMLPHNVYTSFPFLTEMLSLLAMVVRDDWYWGALAGKTVLMSFAPLTALAIFVIGQRWFHPLAGWLAALIHLTTPWTYRISIIAYAEGGLTFFLTASLLATLLAVERMRKHEPAGRLFFLAGLLAGSAMGCKYPGLLSVVLPLATVAVIAPFALKLATADRKRIALQSVAMFGLGTAITVGPWLLKNAVETGNPVYPLLYNVFGGRDWDADLNARWKSAHSPDTYAITDLGEKFIDVTSKSDWLSPLLFGLAPLALFGFSNRRLARWLWLYVAYLFLTWWVFTHRIDRFWIPLIPIVSLLAGAGVVWTTSRIWRWASGCAIALAVLFNLGFITTTLCGYNAYLADIHQARLAAESTSRGIEFLNQLGLPADAKVLMVGEAQVFDARFDLLYNTVFDRSIFQQFCSADAPGASDKEQSMRKPNDIHRAFRERGITHIFVNWREILRYRPTYGYTDFVAPHRFVWLKEHGILGTEIRDPQSVAVFETVPQSDQQEIERWGPELVVEIEGRKVFIASQLYEVQP